jgi:hypothetical protein
VSLGSTTESFFATLKNEMYYRQRFDARAKARFAVAEYIEIFYNRKRLHSSLGYRTPADALTDLFNRPPGPRGVGRGGINGSISSPSRSSTSRCGFVFATTDDDQQSAAGDHVPRGGADGQVHLPADPLTAPAGVHRGRRIVGCAR